MSEQGLLMYCRFATLKNKMCLLKKGKGKNDNLDRRLIKKYLSQYLCPIDGGNPAPTSITFDDRGTLLRRVPVNQIEKLAI